MTSVDESLRNLCVYFQVHQPRRLQNFRFFDIDSNQHYYHDALNAALLRQIAKDCYLPFNDLLLKLIRQSPELRVTFSISGVTLEQFRDHAPEVLDSFQRLAASSQVEFLSETYYHSLSALTDKQDFREQVQRHSTLMKELLGVSPTVFRNTELIYSDNIGREVSDMGYKAMLMEGVGRVMANRKINRLYTAASAPTLRLLPRNYPLSDDIGFRFGHRHWSEWPLTAAKFMRWIHQLSPEDELVTLGLDYETFGEHHKSGTGIFRFMEEFLLAASTGKRLRMVTPSMAVAQLQPDAALSVPYPTSWADTEKDISAWLGNDMQQDALSSLQALQPLVKASNDPELTAHWHMLQTSDHFYYMSTKRQADGSVHAHFSHYPSPHEAFLNYMNILTDLRIRLVRAQSTQPALAQVI